MNTPETKLSPTTVFTEQDVRRKAGELRAETTVRMFRGLARLLSAGYARLAARGAEMNNPARSSRGLF